MISLADLQASFQSAILDNDERILGHILDGVSADRATLLAVYGDAYLARLLDVMDKRHPRLRAFVGEAAFDLMARAYVATHSSRTPSLRWFCRELPAFLARTPPYAACPCLSELAKIEAALGDAFDAADDAVLAASDLFLGAGLTVVVRPHASARRLDLSTNALPIWSAIGRGESPPEPAARQDVERVIVWRQNFLPVLRSLSTEEAATWDAMAAGMSFHKLSGLMATAHGPESVVAAQPAIAVVGRRRVC